MLEELDHETDAAQGRLAVRRLDVVVVLHDAAPPCMSSSPHPSLPCCCCCCCCRFAGRHAQPAEARRQGRSARPDVHDLLPPRGAGRAGCSHLQVVVAAGRRIG
eukprot:scaffold1803_cov320-Prasinococcus_capsulatus_cf.AAC.6